MEPSQNKAGTKKSVLLAMALLGAFVGLASAAHAQQDPQPGQLLTVKLSDHNTLPDAAENLLISYVSTSLGKPAVVYGTVAIPKSKAPEGGYPVVSWGPGSTGAAPQCSASIVQTYATAYLNEWVKRGYAVLRTDDAGWGADWPRPEVDPSNDSNAIADIVTAAHSLDHNLSNDWIVIGHSLGGGGALWTASLKKKLAGKYELKGAIGLAPVGPGILKFMRGALNGEPVPLFVQQFLSLTVIGAKLQDPSIDLGGLVTPEMMPQVDLMRNAACLGDPRFMALPHLQAGHYLKPGADFDKLEKVLEKQDPSSLTMQVPVFIAQGTDDETTVTPATTKPMAESLCAHGAQVTYKLYDHQTHVSVIYASKDDAFSFADAVFAGRIPAGSCGNH